MLGSQIGLYLTRSSLDNNLKDLFYLINGRLEKSMLKYNYSGGEIISVQLLVYRVYYTDVVVELQSYNSTVLLGKNKDLVDVYTNMFSELYKDLIPFTFKLI